eukprot:358996-Chlamydomonas_euryale.AAC.12
MRHHGSEMPTNSKRQGTAKNDKVVALVVLKNTGWIVWLLFCDVSARPFYMLDERHLHVNVGAGEQHQLGQSSSDRPVILGSSVFLGSGLCARHDHSAVSFLPVFLGSSTEW